MPQYAAASGYIDLSLISAQCRLFEI